MTMTATGRALAILAVVAMLSVCTEATCKSRCVPSDMVANTEEFKAERRAVFECLFDQADANKDGKITAKEFDKFTHRRLNILERAPLYWSVVTSWCNCDCDSTSITWEDINGSEKDCLGSQLLVEQAAKRLCKSAA
jgi:hypothetical protein